MGGQRDAGGLRTRLLVGDIISKDRLSVPMRSGEKYGRDYRPALYSVTRSMGRELAAQPEFSRAAARIIAGKPTAF